jgi:hypothetical protein
MKGQISFVEYLAALTLFIISVTYIAFQLIGFIPSYLNTVSEERARIDTYQISELLVNDPGNPINWYSSSSILRMGLSNESLNATNFLSLQKIQSLNNYCNAKGGYDNVRRNISAIRNFTIILFNRTKTSGQCVPAPFCVLINCTPSEPYSSLITVSVRRIISIDSNDIGELIVETG